MLNTALTTDELAGEFVDLACLSYSVEDVSRRERAVGMLDERPEMTAASVCAAAAAFDIAALSQHLEGKPACVVDAELSARTGRASRARRPGAAAARARRRRIGP